MKQLKQFWQELWQPSFLECGFKSQYEKFIFDLRVHYLLRWIVHVTKMPELVSISNFFQRYISDPYLDTEAGYIIKKRSQVLAAIITKDRDLRLISSQAITKHPEYELSING